MPDLKYSSSQQAGMLKPQRGDFQQHSIAHGSPEHDGTSLPPAEKSQSCTNRTKTRVVGFFLQDFQRKESVYTLSK